MTAERNRAALRALDHLTRRCSDLVRERTLTARYQREDERSEAFREQLHRARHYLQLAADTLEGRRGLAQLLDDSREAPTGWLRERLGSMVGTLSGRVPEEHCPTVDSCCSPLTGDSCALAVPELIEALHAQRRTGVLRVTHPEDVIELHFGEGELVHAFSHSAPAGQRLGEILVRRGALSERELRSALARNVDSPTRIGVTLTRDGWIRAEQLEEALDEQVRSLFTRLWKQDRASYTFEPGLPQAPEERSVWNVTQLLLEGAPDSDAGSAA